MTSRRTSGYTSPGSFIQGESSAVFALSEGSQRPEAWTTGLRARRLGRLGGGGEVFFQEVWDSVLVPIPLPFVIGVEDQEGEQSEYTNPSQDNGCALVRQHLGN